MPMRVPDASHLGFADLMDRLCLDQAAATAELRSTGKDLYVKEGPAKGGLASTRVQHRIDAYELVRNSLREQYRCTDEDAAWIMTKVLGHTDRITVGDVCELQMAAVAANRLMSGQTESSVMVAFDQVVQTERLKSLGMSDEDARKSALLIAKSIGMGCSEDSSFKAVLVLEKVLVGTMTALQGCNELLNVDERDAFLAALKIVMSSDLPPYGESDVVQKLMWRNIADVFGIPDFVPRDELDTLKATYRTSLLSMASDGLNERTSGVFASSIPTPPMFDIEDATKQGKDIAGKLISGRMTALAARAELADRTACDAFFDAIEKAMATLPPYDKCDSDTKWTWQYIAGAYATPDFAPFRKADSLDVSYKASMVQAISAKCIRQRCLDPMGIGPEDHLMVEFNKILKLRDVVTPDEMKTFNAFLETCRTDPDLTEAREAWPTLKEDARKAAIQRMVKLHAKAFGYAVPSDYVVLRNLGGQTTGQSSGGGARLRINSSHPQFNDFWCTFNTVCHECTHKYQHTIARKLASGRIDPTSPSYDQKRLIAAAVSSPVSKQSLEEAGYRSDIAYAAYRNEPREMHAFYMGDFAEHHLRRCFS